MFKKNPTRPTFNISLKRTSQGYRVVSNEAFQLYTTKKIVRSIYRRIYLSNDSWPHPDVDSAHRRCWKCRIFDSWHYNSASLSCYASLSRILVQIGWNSLNLEIILPWVFQTRSEHRSYFIFSKKCKLVLLLQELYDFYVAGKCKKVFIAFFVSKKSSWRC